MEAEASNQNQWRFAQCFGDKGEVDEITEGACLFFDWRAAAIKTVQALGGCN